MISAHWGFTASSAGRIGTAEAQPTREPRMRVMATAVAARLRCEDIVFRLPFDA